jgi:hypothetical protein
MIGEKVVKKVVYVLSFILLVALVHLNEVLGAEDIKLPKGLDGVSIGGVSYISYKSMEKSGETTSNFDVRRAYLTIKKPILPGLSSRITIDAHQNDEGDMESRLKYMYVLYKMSDFSIVTKPAIEFGIVHTPWLDFEQYVNYYRMREKMFIERSGSMNSADFGATFTGLIGGQMDDHYKKSVNRKYPGRYGSFAVGIYNGGGYHAIEENQNKVIEGRLTIRPLPDVIPGLQVSGFGTYGKGNKSGGESDLPDWNSFLSMISYEHKYITFTAQYMGGSGNQKGSWTKATDPKTSLDYGGFSLFSEGKLGANWRTIAGFDSFDPDVDDVNSADNDFVRYYVGIGYDFGHRNILMFDYDVKDIAVNDENDYWYQLTMQLHF